MARYVKEIMRGAGRGSNRLSLVRKGNPSLFSPQRAACGWCLESNQKPAGKTRRPAVATIEDAQKRADNSRKATYQTTLIEVTSGNMRIELSFMAALKGYKLVLTMPSYTSLERRVMISAFGANLVLTNPTKGMKGTVKTEEGI